MNKIDKIDKFLIINIISYYNFYNMKLLTKTNVISAIDQLREYIESLPIVYKYVYTSFGSKLNENLVNTSFPVHNTFYSNALYQMIPQFVRLLSIKIPILLIIIDDFIDEDIRNKNIKNIKHISEQYQNIDIIIINELITSPQVNPIINIILDHAVKCDILPTHCLFSNFIRFRQPNNCEIVYEREIPECIQRTLDEFASGIYEKSFYQWYGYSYYTYNYMYCYKTYNIAYLMHNNTIYKLLHETLQNNQLCDYNRFIVNNSITTNRIKTKWVLFTENSVNIT